MSAICGIFRKRSSLEQCGEAVNRMTNSMKLIGPDSLNIRSFGTVTLAHQALIVSPHEKTDTQPIYLPDEGLSIIFDGRIYNRSEIYETLKDRPRPDAPDAHLLLKLYEQIGTEAFHKANGEFAIAIYDHRKNELRLACDPIGTRALYYTETPEFIAFASSTDAIASLPEVESGIDELTLVAFFFGAFDLAQGRSPFKAIKSVSPAHSITIAPHEVSNHRYYSFSNNLGSQNISLKDCIEKFRYEIIRSVKDRMQSPGKIGTTLSGGLDSSVVTAIAAQHLKSKSQTLHAFSAVPTKANDAISLEEIAHIQTVAKNHSNIQLHPIVSDQSGPFSNLETQIKEDGRPPDAFYYITEKLANTASKLGIQTVLTGLGGDMLVSSNGLGTFIAQLFSKSSLSSPRHLRNTLLKHRSIKGFLGNEIIIPLFPESISSKLVGKNSIKHAIKNGILRTEFLDSNGISEQLSARSFFANRVFKNNLMRVSSALDTGILAINNNFWRGQQIEFLHPLEDLRLIEFCLGLPQEYFAYGKQKRGLYRAAAKGIIPDSVRLRNSKGAFIPRFHQCVRGERETIDRILGNLETNHPIWNIVDKIRFNQSLKRIMSDTNNYQMGHWNLATQCELFPTIAYALFLSLEN